MITPSFRIDQDNDHLYIIITAPYAKTNEIDVFAEDNDFRFHCKPYYLRLNLPGKVYDTDGEQRGKYDYDKGIFTYKVIKQTPGENFEGLDLLTKLLTQPKAQTPAVLIEEIPNSDEVEVEEDENDENSGDEWFVEQNIQVVDDALSSVKYGFAMTKTNIFAKLSEEYQLVIDLPEPDATSYEQRKILRIQNENEKFNEDHYMADLHDCEYIEDALLSYKPFWSELSASEIEYTDAEIDVLKALPKRTYLLDKMEKFYAYTGLVDILFAYCYNNRANCGEENVEAGWTISKLSSTLSWFDVHKSIEDAVVACFRRCLIFPLYRHWKLCEYVLRDMINLFKKGSKAILKCLIDCRQIFIDGDCRYILNDLYIIDYCIWIQYAKEKTLNGLVENLEKLKITKQMMNLDLDNIESVAKMVLENETEESSQTEDEDDDEEEETSDDENNKKNNTSTNKPNTDDECSQQLSNLLNLNKNDDNNTTTTTNDAPSTTSKQKIIELD